ncbi:MULTISPECIES: conjugal transfer protein TrbF [Gammaproteobacteria]|jgi:type IV secretory pathway TrbF-like protein|uniref:Bacterial virulence protein VirB8 domain-containing protein n=3 Tax=root TaxID=1 RepID=A0A899NF00_ECOLX|nr:MULTISPECIES: conjugal transfer protein TrbF [Gammaproteobacteria]AEV56835.1 TrbF [uncultured bacterium]QDL89391.1 conjugal transfer protein TrbF [Sym plasmid]AEV57041.1 TrbF [uncultured bacterium]AEV57386.1 TrbF [uncultured bacterium]AKI06415.1 TrbF [uncultured bacterium]
MSFADTIKGLIFKKKPDRRQSPQSSEAGPRSSGLENPYLSARRTWNEHVGSVVSSRQTWQVVGILSLLIALAGVGGVIHIGSQSKFIPYVVQVDKMGQTIAAGPVTAADKADPRIVHATVADFITSARMVTPDVALQRKAVFKVYSVLSPNDPATAKMNEWLNGNADASPFKRAAKEMVNIEITSVIPQSPDTWQVDWTETTRDRQGALKGQPVPMRALVTVYTAEPTSQTTDEQLRNNPMGIYVRDYSWSRLL